MKNKILEIKDLKVNIEERQIIKGLNIELKEGAVHVLMGPNGSGKSTLAQVLMGHPAYEVSKGSIEYAGEDLLVLGPNERSQKGVFLSFQYPSEIPGVAISNYLRMIYNKKAEQKMSPVKFRQFVLEKMAILEMDESFLHRYLNEGFSGGEKKRMEILQLLVLEPKLAILDETDSGLDVDAIRIVSKAVNYLKEKTDMTVLLITHYTRILKYIEPDTVFVMRDGAIVQTGDKKLADELEEKGYAPFGE